MSLPIRRSLTHLAVLALIGITTSGCMADFVSPLSVATHRYPSVAQRQAASKPLRPQQIDEAYVATDRLPTAKEIFDLHPRGSDPGKMRQPFILDPHEGPLKISSLSAEDAAAENNIRSTQTATAARMAVLRPVMPAPTPMPTPQSVTAARSDVPFGHQ